MTETTARGIGFLKALFARTPAMETIPVKLAFALVPALFAVSIAVESAHAENRHVHVTSEVCQDEVCTSSRMSIWDGDTFTIDREGHPLLKIRIENIDAPEIDGRCAFEAHLAQQSKRRLAQLLTGTIVIRLSKRDNYGRQLASVSRAGADVGQTLVGERLARHWTGARHKWCTDNGAGTY